VKGAIMETQTVSKFQLGQIVSTPNALEQLTHDDIMVGLTRHQSGDWGDVAADDHQENEMAVNHGLRVFSVYHSATGTKFWIITEADRSATVVLLPEDY